MPGKNNDGSDFRLMLAESEVEKDLGVQIDHGLSFKEQVALSTAKANKIVGLIRRSFDYLTEQTFVQRP